MESSDIISRTSFRTLPEEWQFEVYQSDGKVLASSRPLKQTPPFDTKLNARHPGFEHPTLCHKVHDGWLLVYNYGEFGAEFWWSDEEGKARYKIGTEAVNSLKQIHGRLLAALGSDYVVSSDGAVAEVAKVNGRWRFKEVVPYTTIILDIAELPGGNIALLAFDHIILVNEGSHITIRGNELALSYARGMCSDEKGNLYFGGRMFIRKLLAEGQYKALTHLVPDTKRLERYRAIPEPSGVFGPEEADSLLK